MEPLRLVVPPRDATPGGAAHAGDAHGPTGVRTRRILPERRLAAVGAWCLVEQFGDPATRPEQLTPIAYPEAGLASLTVLLDGVVRRRDSLGNDALLHHGGAWLATAGTGIVATETGVDDPRGGRHARRFLNGVRLAAALPAERRWVAPSLQALTDPPQVVTPSMRATLLVGALAAAPDDASPVEVATPLLAADVTLTTGTERLALDRAFEHGVLLLDGTVSVDGTPLRPHELAYIPLGRERIDLATLTGARLLLLGGTPFEEEFILWWNLLAGSHDEIAAAHDAWTAAAGPFAATPEGARRALAPALPPVRLRPRRGSVRTR